MLLSEAALRGEDEARPMDLPKKVLMPNQPTLVSEEAL